MHRRHIEEGNGARRGSEANLKVESADAGVSEDYVAILVSTDEKSVIIEDVVIVIVEDDEDVLEDCFVLENSQNWDYRFLL